MTPSDSRNIDADTGTAPGALPGALAPGAGIAGRFQADGRDAAGDEFETASKGRLERCVRTWVRPVRQRSKGRPE